MALKIVKASQSIEVKNLITCLYAPPGLGKTSMAFTADSTVLLDFDNGAYRSQFRKDTVQIANWSEIEQITAADLATYNTVVVDTAGRALDSLSAELIRKNTKFKGIGGQLSLQGFGVLKAGFSGWLNLLKSFGKDIILIAHMEEKQVGEDLVERLDIQGGSKGEIYKVADVMGRIRIEGSGQNTKRLLDFNPSASGFGKNPAQLPVQEVPHFSQCPDYLSAIISTIKQELNKQSEEARKSQEDLQRLRVDLQCLESEEDFQDAVEHFREAPSEHKRLLNEIAKSKGFAFNKDEGKYIKVAV